MYDKCIVDKGTVLHGTVFQRHAIMPKILLLSTSSTVKTTHVFFLNSTFFVKLVLSEKDTNF